jgi:hypothetical protein
MGGRGRKGYRRETTIHSFPPLALQASAFSSHIPFLCQPFQDETPAFLYLHFAKFTGTSGFNMGFKLDK